MSTVGQIPCELCGVLIFTRTSSFPDWDGRCDCLECGGRHAVCGCALEWELFQIPMRPLTADQVLRACPDNVIVVRELMRPERPPGLPRANFPDFAQMQQQLAKTIRNCFVSTAEDFTDFSGALKEIVKATGVTTGDFAAALAAFREAAHAEAEV